MKPSRFSILRSHALNLAGLLTLSSGATFGADIFWDGSDAGAAVTSWASIGGWSSVQAGGTNPAAVPGVDDTIILRADSIKTGALSIAMDGTRSILGFKSNFYGTGLYSQEAVTTITAPTGTSSILRLFGIPTTTAGRTLGIDHAAGGITLGSSALPLMITIHSPHQTWNSNVVGGTAPGAAAVVVNGSVTGGISGNVTLVLAGQNTGTTINGEIGNGISNLSLEVNGTPASIWMHNGPGTYTGSTAIKSGTLRITRADSIHPDVLNNGRVTVDSANATLALRVGPGTFTADDITHFMDKVVYTAGGSLALDTVNSAAEVNGGLRGIAVFKKMGANPLILNGPNIYTSATAFRLEEGSVAIRSTTGVFAGSGAGLGKINVVNGTAGTSGLLALVGPTGMPEANVPSIASMTTATTPVTTLTNIGLSTAAGDGTYAGGLFGDRRWFKGDPGTLILLGNRSDTGGVSITGGTLRVVSLPATSGPAPFGVFDTADKLRINGGRFMYAGPALTTDRVFSMYAGGTLDSSGYGGLVLSGTGYTQAGTSARTLTLTGYAPGENKISGALTNAGSGVVTLTKQGSAAWTLAGTNTYTGVTRNNGGNLTLDYTAGGDPVSTGEVHLNAGEILVKGTTAGTSETFNVFRLGINQHTSGTLKLAGRVNLTISSLTSPGAAQRSDLIDISSNTNNSITVGSAPANSAISVVNGVLLVNTGTSGAGRANIILKDKDNTYGFPTLSLTTSGTLVKAATTTIPAGPSATFSSNSTNYRVTKGEREVTQTLDYHTITLDSKEDTVSTANEITLSLSGSTFSPSGTGKGILLTGNNNITINNYSSFNSSTQPIWFHNYLEPNATFNLDADFSQQYLMFSGSGFTDYKGMGFTQNFYLFGSLVRISGEQSLAAGAGNFRLAAGAVLEVNADLFGLELIPEWSDVDFVKPVRITPTGGIAFYGDSGMSAYVKDLTPNAKRVVHFGIADGEGVPVSQNLTWGTARFLTQPDSDTDGDYTFKLSSPRSNAMLEFRNNINLNGRSRNIEVANGSASVDAQMKGVLSGSDASGIIKSGEGTLQLSGQNTYKGETRIQAGLLKIGVGNLHAASSVSIITSASGGSGKLDVTGAVSVAAVSIDGVAQPTGKVTSPHITGTGALYVGGILTPYQQWAANSGLGSGESAGDFDADFDGIKNVVEYAVGTNPKASTASVLTKVAGSPVALRFNRATTNPERTDLTLVLEASTDLGTTWTPLATSTGGAAMVSNQGTSIAITEASGVVTVTDNRTLGTKTFYRLRATVP